MKVMLVMSLLAVCLAVAGCDEGTGSDPTEADEVGVGADCAALKDCQPSQAEAETDTEADLVCLTQFKGGYCGLSDCTANEECPQGSVCVAHDDGQNYCFLSCTEKFQCNVNRSTDIESNCSANIEFVDPDTTGKACVPPSAT